MKALSTLIIAFALAVTAASCGDSNTTTPPTNNNPPPAQNNTTTTTEYRLSLKPANERPNPVTNAESGTSGAAIIKISITKDPAFNIVSASAAFDVQVSGFPAGSSVNIAHIHPGDLNATGGIIVNTTLVAGELVLTNGTGTFQKTVSVDGSVAQSIVSNPAAFYFNVHSTLNPGGVVRAQMDNTGAAPAEPGEPKPGDPNDPYYIPGRAR